jgi:hypothetical protein
MEETFILRISFGKMGSLTGGLQQKDKCPKKKNVNKECIFVETAEKFYDFFEGDQLEI